MTRSMKGCINNKNDQSINRILRIGAIMRATSEELTIFVAVVESGVSAGRPNSWAGELRHQPLGEKLEMKLGVSLLNRTTRQLSLTEEGERYFRRVQVVLQEMAAAENDLETRTTPRGLLRVDAATPVMLHFLMPLVKPFRERYPEMTLSLVSSGDVYQPD